MLLLSPSNTPPSPSDEFRQQQNSNRNYLIVTLMRIINEPINYKLFGIDCRQFKRLQWSLIIKKKYFLWDNRSVPSHIIYPFKSVVTLKRKHLPFVYDAKLTMGMTRAIVDTIKFSRVEHDYFWLIWTYTILLVCLILWTYNDSDIVIGDKLVFF